MTQARSAFVGAAAIALVVLLFAIGNAFDRTPEPVASTAREVEPVAAIEAVHGTSTAPIAPLLRTDAKDRDEPAVVESAADATAGRSLVVIVMREEASALVPLAGVRVRLLMGAAVRGEEFRPDAAPVAELRTDAEGRVSFAGLTAASYLARADYGDTHVCGSAVVGRFPLMLVFGTATVAGIVVDAGGKPLAGIAVGSIEVSLTRPSRGVSDATTGPDGRFLLCDLSAGRRYVFAEGHDDQHMVELDAGERAEIVLGGEVAPLARWSGTLRDGEGQPIPGLRRAIARNLVTRDERDLAIGADGRFEASLPFGRWQVHARDRLWLGAVLGTGELAAAGLQSDLVWPGCRIVLTLVVDQGAAVDYASAARQLWLTGPERSTLDPPEGPFDSLAGPYLQLLVPNAGRYRLTTGGGVRLPGDGPIAIEVASAARVHRQTVHVR